MGRNEEKTTGLQCTYMRCKSSIFLMKNEQFSRDIVSLRDKIDITGLDTNITCFETVLPRDRWSLENFAIV